MYTPIILFTYSRLEHTSRTVEALRQNHLAEKSDLIIFSDAAKTPANENAVMSVRKYIAQISGFRSVTIYQREQNLGLSASIISGVTQVLKNHSNIIVLEDDMVTSPWFLTYMNQALDKFADDDRVISIHGYTYPVEQKLPEAFFLPGADCWGWATWRRGWQLFNPDGQFLLDQLQAHNKLHDFDYHGCAGYSDMLRAQIAGRNDSWAIRWYASAFLANKFTLYPGRSLVHNIGNDASGTHCATSNKLDVLLSKTPINLNSINVQTSEIAYQSFSHFFKQSKPNILNKIKNRLLFLLERKR